MKDFFSSIHPVDSEILDEYLDSWVEYAVPKKTIITHDGDTERYLYFVKEGIQKSTYSYGGKEHVLFFAYPPSLSGIVESFLTQTPSRYSMETITKSEFFRIDYRSHEVHLQQHKSLETLFKKLTEFLLLGVIERQHELLAFSAEERFKVFVQRSPHLLNMVAQKDIASYLRIDPTNFSKLMNSGII